MTSSACVFPEPTAAAFAAHLHPPERRGWVTVANGDGGWNECRIRPRDLPEFIAKCGTQTNQYLSYHTFNGRRRLKQLAQLGALYVDLDYYKIEALRHLPPDHVSHQVLVAIDDARLPKPSEIIFSGHGLLVVWHHGLVPANALPRWNAMQKHLGKELAQFGADTNAADAARVFRVVGSVNSKSDEVVRQIYRAPGLPDGYRYDFDDLTKEILPKDRPNAARPPREKARRTGRPAGASHEWNGRTYWVAVRGDLDRLLELRWKGKLPEGHRDAWLLIAGTALSWTCSAADLPDECRRLADEAAGWSCSETNSRLSAVFSLMQKAARGEKVAWRGKQRDPRYHFRVAEIIERLQITPAEMERGQFRVLLNPELRRRRRAARKTVARRAAGQRPREAFEAGAKARAVHAAGLRAGGMTWAEVARAMGLPSADAARMLAKRARSPNRTGLGTCMVGVASLRPLGRRLMKNPPLSPAILCLDQLRGEPQDATSQLGERLQTVDYPLGNAGCEQKSENLMDNNEVAADLGRWSRLSEAISYALTIHADQTRKGSGIPYIGHLLGVASLVLEAGGDEEQAIAGMLHDSIEDVGIEQEALIGARFGARVAAIVRACTDADTTPKPPWRARKEAYIAHLEYADSDALLVSCADKVFNCRAIVTDLRTLGPVMFNRFTGGADGTMWYYSELAKVFARRLPGPLSRELTEAVGEMMRLGGGERAAGGLD